MAPISPEQIDLTLRLLGERLSLAQAGPYRLVVCGGAALIACALISRQTTKDIDVVAMMDATGLMLSPDPLPPALLQEAARVARDLDLPPDWLNNGPSREPGGLFQLGLPAGFQERLVRRDYGAALTVYFAGRLDQICFKLYAAVDQGAGRHLSDLRELNPTHEEIALAARWAVTHDPSDGFRQVLISLLRQLGHDDIASIL